MLKKLTSSLLAIIIAGCATIPTGQIIEPAGPAPTRSQAEGVILSTLARTLRDPESLRQFAINGEPQIANGTTAGRNIEQGWLVCFEYNAKNGYGGYTGLKREGYILRLSGDEFFVVSPINWVAVDRHCS